MKRYCEYATYLLSTMFVLDFGLMIYFLFIPPHAYAGISYVMFSFLPLFIPAFLFFLLIWGVYWYKDWGLEKSHEMAFLYISSIAILIKAALYVIGLLFY